MDIVAVLSELTALPGPSGREGPVTRRAAELLQPWVDTWEIDRQGNLLGVKRGGQAPARRILLDAHLDEVGFLVTAHDKGFLRFRAIGGLDPLLLQNREIVLLSDPPLVGLVACLPPHVQNDEELERVQPIEDLFIDTGLSETEAKRRLPIGTFGVFRSECFRFGKDRVAGHALDDRAGFAVLLCVMEMLQDTPLPFDIVVCGSVQEEVGYRGAKTAAFGAAPDACIAVDVTHAHTPDASKDRTFALGGGPCVGMGPNCDRKMASALCHIAREEGIPHQIEVMEGSSGTNGWAVQTSRTGVPTAIVSVPLRYMHTPLETLHLDDIKQTARLLKHYLEKRFS